LLLVGQGGSCGGVDLTNVQCKVVWNCNNELPLDDEYILVEMGEKLTPRTKK
jgi:hypothetical protein